jgi:hypothetical protein
MFALHISFCVCTVPRVQLHMITSIPHLTAFMSISWQCDVFIDIVLLQEL